MSTPLPEPALGPLLSTIQKNDLVAESGKYTSSARITDFDYVASFSWRDSRKPSVFIPGKPLPQSTSHSHIQRSTSKPTDAGSPPRWTPVIKPKRLPWDKNEYPLDRNGYHFPKHPFEATALSVLLTQPEPPPKPLDIVCSSSSLGYLISFCLIEPEDFRTFRVLVEVIGGAVHIFRRDNAPGQMLENVKGFGHTFPEANTTWDAGTAGSTSHQRVVRYSLGGLNILIRGEIDGYIPKSSQAGTPSREKASIDDLLKGLSSSSLSPKAADTSTSTIAVTKAGSPPPQSSLFDLKTRSEHRKSDDLLGAQLPRLWRSQIPNFVLAFHERGTFHDVSIQNVRDRINEWERENAEGIAVLVALLQRLVAVVGSSPGGKVEVCATVGSEIEVREQLPDAGEAFSPAVREKWEGWLEKARGESAVALGSSSEYGGGSEEVGRHSSGEEDPSNLNYSDAESPDDFTACSADACGYCGRCTY
ncbi:hypothetical protein IMZ48_38145 [Candidatus Bathyarchaeota archaeon]|nr:hypothetical protein [Candidatus Bathyarchaeota archaeon]